MKNPLFFLSSLMKLGTKKKMDKEKNIFKKLLFIRKKRLAIEKELALSSFYKQESIRTNH